MLQSKSKVRHTVEKRYPGDDKARKTDGAVDLQSTLSKSLGVEPRVV
jgi:hypothetical protein